MFISRSSMNRPSPARAGRLAVAMVSAAFLAACASSGNQAPVLDRTSRAGSAGTVSQEPPPPATIGSSVAIPCTASPCVTAKRRATWWPGTTSPTRIRSKSISCYVSFRRMRMSATPGPWSRRFARPTRPRRRPIPHRLRRRPQRRPALLPGQLTAQSRWPGRHAARSSTVSMTKATKGIDIGGKRGDAVVAADDGKVIPRWTLAWVRESCHHQTQRHVPDRLRQQR